MKIIFDTETTGLLNPSASSVDEQPQIIEIFCLKIDDDLKVVDEFQRFVKPSVPLPAIITKITGIEEYMLEDAPSFPAVYAPLADFFLGCDELIAHNASFDTSMIGNELIRIGKLAHFPWPIKHTCTVQATLPINGSRMNLGKLYTHVTGNPMPNSHRAKDDVMALYECYKWCVREGICV